ncbi:MAG: P-loop NTPase [Firmicutes bacterium]|nr:P-loop NTPase [Bacillota bacterium]
MQELLIISGKGGTGKTSITAGFAALARNIVIADCDVDAANLHMLLRPVTYHTEGFIGSQKAEIDPHKCTNCRTCEEHCRFDAIKILNAHSVVIAMACEGCGVCRLVCPEGAVTLEDHMSGHLFLSDTRYGPLVHARLGIAEENSGKLVAKVRENARLIAETQDSDYIIIDGPPGTGCPVISSSSGVDLALIVTEPTVAGLHDLKRVHRLIDHFAVPAMVCINKWDLDKEYAEEIETYCRHHKIELAGRIPFDRGVVSALAKGLPAVDYEIAGAPQLAGAGHAIQHVWQAVLHRLSSLSA